MKDLENQTSLNPLVSICIPAYNVSKYIEEAIIGWQNQSYKNIEIIVQDDFSSDNTYSLAFDLSQKDSRVKVFKNEINLGIGANWNEVAKKAKGDYFIMANADDIYEPYIIENSLSIFFSDSKIDIVSHKYCFYHEKTKQTSIAASQEKLKVGIQPNLFKLSFFNNPFHIVFTVFNKKKIDEIMLDNGSLFLETQVCDVELFFRAGIKNFNLYYSDYLAGKYRKHESNNSDKPNGERYSWLFDVFPIYRQFLLENHKIETRNLIKNNIIHLFKYHIKNLKLIDIRQLRAFVKECFVFIK